MNASLPTRCRSACWLFAVVIATNQGRAPSDGTSALRIFACGETVDYATENAPEVTRRRPGSIPRQGLRSGWAAADVDPGLNDFTRVQAWRIITMQEGGRSL